MRLALLFILLCSLYHANGQKTALYSYGIKIALPANWTISNTDGVYTCYSPGQTAAIMIIEDKENSLVYYNLALRLGVDLGDGITVKTPGKLISINARSAYSEVLIMSLNGNTKGWGGLLQTKSGATIGFLAIANPQQLDDTKKKMLSMLSSCEELSGNETYGTQDNGLGNNSSLLKTWFSILTNNRLEGNFNSYSSGYNGDGYYSSSQFDFCPNGMYKYYYEYNSSLSGTSTKREAGVWRLMEDAGNVILHLTSNDGNVKKYNLSKKSNVVYLNDAKYLMGEYRPACE